MLSLIHCSAATFYRYRTARRPAGKLYAELPKEVLATCRGIFCGPSSEVKRWDTYFQEMTAT
jgi:hypothetical protein